jgi:NRAMP (natural resistance-associated macrophage protein)-like metal ion transporter
MAMAQSTADPADTVTADQQLDQHLAPPRWRGRRLLLLVGPALMVMLADTDAGSIITAAQSGAQYGYRLVLAQVVLIPILYLVQEITARLGLATGQGHGAMIRAHFGRWWALLSAATLFVACVGALITEFAGVAGVGSLVGLPRWVSIGISAVALCILVLLGGYRRVEGVGLAIGALELLFLPAALIAGPHAPAVLGALAHPLQTNPDYLNLLAANVGAVIMPWMIFYQQEAVINKGRRGLDLRQALRSVRVDTAVGSVVTQLVMIAVVVMIAATVGATNPGASLNSVGDIAQGLMPFLGHTSGIVFFGLGMVGAALIATLVVSLAGAWGVSEVLGWRRSLNDSPRRAGGFHGLAVVAILGGALLVLLAPSLVNLSVGVEVMNACLLPIVLGFLLILERRALPEELRMRGLRRITTYLLVGLVFAFGLYTAAQALPGIGG